MIDINILCNTTTHNPLFVNYLCIRNSSRGGELVYQENTPLLLDTFLTVITMVFHTHKTLATWTCNKCQQPNTSPSCVHCACARRLTLASFPGWLYDLVAWYRLHVHVWNEASRVYSDTWVIGVSLSDPHTCQMAFPQSMYVLIIIL